MTQIDTNQDKYIVTFKRKDLRPNKTDDKLELFRSIIGLSETRDLLDLNHFTGHHKTTPIEKTKETITDINSFKTPFIMARLTEDQANRLRKNPNVLSVVKSGFHKVAAQTIDWWVPQIKASNVWATPLSVRGMGANVAVIDTGCDYNHLDLSANVKVNQSFIDTDSSPIAKDAPHYHGTHVCGIIGAMDNAEGVVGGAPSCNIWNLRGGDASGIFTYADEIEAITYADSNGAHAINMSFGGYVETLTPLVPLREALKEAYANGLIMIGAAGNDNLYNNNFYPATFPTVLAVSSLQQDNIASSFTNFGPYVDFAGYGTNINSTMNNNAYQVLSGTSMACPTVCALAALAISAFDDNGCPPYSPTRTRGQVIAEALRMSVSKLGKFTTDKSEVYGYGVPQADKLVALMKGITL